MTNFQILVKGGKIGAAACSNCNSWQGLIAGPWARSTGLVRRILVAVGCPGAGQLAAAPPSGQSRAGQLAACRLLPPPITTKRRHHPSTLSCLGKGRPISGAALGWWWCDAPTTPVAPNCASRVYWGYESTRMWEPAWCTHSLDGGTPPITGTSGHMVKFSYDPIKIIKLCLKFVLRQ